MSRHVITCKTNKQWRVERSKSVGASAVGIIIGESHFCTPMELAHTMRIELEGFFDYTETEEQADGHDLEPYIAAKFARKSGYEIIASSANESVIWVDEYPWIHASLDRTYWLDPQGCKHGKHAEQNKGVLECKSTFLAIDEDNLPVSWIFQLQVQMGLSGYHKGAIAWYIKRAHTFGYKEFEFNEEIFNAALVVSKDFWERCVIGGEEPEPVSVADYQRMYPYHVKGKTITASQELIEKLAEIKRYSEVRGELDDTISKMKDEVKMLFTDEEAIVNIDGRVLATYKTNTRMQRVLLIK